MITRDALIKKGIKYERVSEPRSFRWLPGTYNLSTSEFNDSGDFNTMNYKTYLLLWEMRLNHGSARIELRDDKGRILSARTANEHFVVGYKRNNRLYYTLIKIKGGINEDTDL